MPILDKTLNTLSNLSTAQDLGSSESIAEISKIVGAYTAGFVVAGILSPLPKSSIDRLFYGLTGRAVPAIQKNALISVIVAELVMEGIDAFNETGYGADIVEKGVDIFDDLYSEVEGLLETSNDLINDFESMLDDFLNGWSDSIDGIIDNLSAEASSWLSGMADSFMRLPELFGDMANNVSDDVNDFFNRALAFIAPQDPLALDLDGDGIETLPANGTVLFDHDGDGTKNGTGWIGADDGILVLDRNGNGFIDNGSELFGDNTIKIDGTLALDGFDALADFDSNGDGVIDTNDAVFSQLRIWRDANSDGISQAAELHNLSTFNIASINTAHTVVNNDLGNGNVARAEGTFNYIDGSEGEVGAAASLDLAANNFYREFPDSIPIPEPLAHLPDMAGSGAVRDLLEAAALSSGLATVLDQFTSASTRDGQMALLDVLIDAWADSGDFVQLADRINALTIGDIYAGEANEIFLQIPLRFSITDPDAEPSPIPQHNDLDSDGLTVGAYADRRAVDVLAKLQVLEVFNDQPFFEFGFDDRETEAQPLPDDYAVYAQTGNTSRVVYTSWGGIAAAMPEYIRIDEQDLRLFSQQMDFIEQAYDALRESVYGALVLKTRLAPYVDAIGLTISEAGELIFDFSELSALLDANKANNAREAYIDLIELNRYGGQQFLYGMGWNGIGMLRDWIDEAAGDPAIEALLGEMHVLHGAGTVNGSNARDIVLGDGGNNTLNGGDGNDILDGGAGNDYLYGGNGDDTLRGGIGNSDYLSGEAGNDTYLFGTGDGNTTIYNYDLEAGRNDVLQFMAGIDPSDVHATRSSNDLLLTMGSTGELITVQNYFIGDGAGGYALNAIEFADGAVRDLKEAA